MTEDEAKMRWCPFVRHGSQSPTTGGTDAGVNRYGLNAPGEVAEFNACIGSECMAWRWSSRTSMHYRSSWVDAPGKTGAEAYLEYIADNPARGYCGLAGKP